MPKDVAPEQMPDLGLASLFGVKGKVAVVTGGGSGVGKMISAALVQNGARVYIASRKLEELERVAAQLRETAPKNGAFAADTACIAIKADIGTKAGCDALAAEISKREKRIDVLVNNSGLTWGGPLTDFPEEKGWDRVFHLNVKSQFYMTVALLPLLEEGKSNTDHASVINIASVAAYSPMASSPLASDGTGTYSYNASKAASVHLTRTLAYEFADKYIMVNALCPGVFPSRMTAWSLGQNREVLEAGQPTGRLGMPEDLGGLVLLLAGRSGSHITGAAIPVDGGQMLQFLPKL